MKLADHFHEWVLGSAVDPEIVSLNVQTIEDLAVDPYTHEASFPIAEVLNWKPVRFGHRVKPKIRGWWVSGVDPLNDWQPMDWGRFKPDPATPIADLKSGKAAKYLSPKAGHGSSRLVLLRVPQHIWQRVSDRYEIPIAKEDAAKGFWYWVWKYNVPIILCEGEKKAGCLLSLGYVAIALPGITGGVRTRDEHDNPVPHRLIPDLEHFATAQRVVFICFDYETRVKTIQDVERETEKLKRLLSKANCQVKIISLPGPQKGIDDFVVAHGGEAFERLYQTALSFERWQVRRYSQLSYPADLELNQRYLGSLPIPESAKLICIKSPKGTGKTESFVEIVAEASRNGQRTLLISHRVQLAQAICDRIGIPYLTEVRTSQTGNLLGFGLCVDSLHAASQARFNADDWHDALVIIDESEQVIWHTLAASTEIQNRRIPVLGELQKLFANILSSEGGRIIVSDADLSNLTLEFIWGLASKVKPWIAVNHWKPDQESWTVHHYAQSRPDQWLAALDRHIAEGGKPFITTQSQKAKSRWSTCTLEQFFKARFPNKRILRIDSQTIADPTHEAYCCTSRLNELLPGYDIVIASPSIETGVSIDIRGHFTSVWGCLQGVTAENSARQSLARVRDPVERHIWIAKFGLGRVGNGATSVKSILAAEYKLAKLSTRLLDLVDEGEEMLTAYAIALTLWGKMACRINAGLIHYRESVLSGLQQEGHQLAEVCQMRDTTELNEAIRRTRDEQHQQECLAIAQAEEITPTQYEDLKSKKSKTPDDWRKQRKHSLHRRYEVEVTPALVAKDDDGWYPQLRLYYYLMWGRNFLKARDHQALETVLYEGGAWLPTLNRSQLGVQVAVLEKLNIKMLLDPERDYRGTDADLVQLAEFAKRHSWEIKAAMHLTIRETDTPIAIAQMFLSKLGLKLTYDRREGPRGNRTRVYRYHRPTDGRDAVIFCWLERDSVSQSQSAVSTPGLNNLVTSGWAEEVKNAG